MFRTTITFLFFIIFGLKTYCQNNSLVFISETATPFYLTVNGEAINKSPEINVKAPQIGTGWQKIHVLLLDSIKQIHLYDSIQISNSPKLLNKEFTYVITKSNTKLNLKYKSTSSLSGPKEPAIPLPPKEQIPIIDNNIYGNVYYVVKNKPIFYNHFNNENNKCDTVLNNKDLVYAKSLILKANDKEASHRYINTIISNNCYNTSQLKELLELEPIDMDRLNSAKVAYNRITDKENINSILSVFKYPSMRESYLNFINEQKSIVNQKELNCKEAINNNQLNELYTKIKNSGYDNEKVDVSKRLLAQNCLSSLQIKKILEIFSHDREKLELAKFATIIILDKENSFMLADEFQYQGTKEEFFKFINYQK